MMMREMCPYITSERGGRAYKDRGHEGEKTGGGRRKRRQEGWREGMDEGRAGTYLPLRTRDR